MKNAAKPVKYGERGRVTVNVLALEKALKAGTLSSRDEAAVELLLPGICDLLLGKVESLRA